MVRDIKGLLKIPPLHRDGTGIDRNNSRYSLSGNLQGENLAGALHSEY